jgi:ribosomal protein L29
MKRNDIKNLHQLEVSELNKKLIELTLVLAKSKLEKKAGKLANPRMVSNLSDDIARIKTILTMKQMVGA